MNTTTHKPSGQMIRTVTEQKEPGRVFVHWRTSERNRGILDIHVPETTDDDCVLAELLAIDYIIREKKMFGGLPQRAGNRVLSVSNYATRMVITKGANRYNDGIEKQCAAYADLFIWRLKGIETRVSQDMSGMAESGTEPEVVKPKKRIGDGTAYMIDSPSMGRVWLTFHAVRRYEECLEKIDKGSDRASNIWDSVVRWVSRDDLKQIPMSEQLEQEKNNKYGEGKTTMWGHPSSRIVLTTEELPNGQVLIKTSFAIDYGKNLPVFKPSKQKVVSESRRLLFEEI